MDADDIVRMRLEILKTVCWQEEGFKIAISEGITETCQHLANWIFEGRVEKSNKSGD